MLVKEDGRMLLLSRCGSMLDYAEQKIEILKNSFEESPKFTSFSGEAADEEQ